MKTYLLPLAAFVFVSAPFVAAQEDKASPLPDFDLRATDPSGQSEPSVVVPAEPSSSNYPKPGTPLSTPRPSPSPAAAGAKTSPSPAPAKAPAPGAAAAATTTATKGDIPATIRALESRWAASIASHDANVAEQLVAADYIGVNSAGRIVNKAALISDMKRDKNTYSSAVNSGVTVRVHGTTAVAVGTTKQAGKDPSGKAFNYTYRWTDTWVERNGQWQCVASQSFVVR